MRPKSQYVLIYQDRLEEVIKLKEQEEYQKPVLGSFNKIKSKGDCGDGSSDDVSGCFSGATGGAGSDCMHGGTPDGGCGDGGGQ